MFWEVHVNQGRHTLVSYVFAVGIVATIIGVLVDVEILRMLQGAPLVLQLMVTVGLMLLFLGVTANIWPPTEPRRLDPFYGNKGFDLGPIVVQWHRLIQVVVSSEER